MAIRQLTDHSEARTDEISIYIDKYDQLFNEYSSYVSKEQMRSLAKKEKEVFSLLWSSRDDISLFQAALSMSQSANFMRQR